VAVDIKNVIRARDFTRGPEKLEFHFHSGW